MNIKVIDRELSFSSETGTLTPTIFIDSSSSETTIFSILKLCLGFFASKSCLQAITHKIILKKKWISSFSFIWIIGNCIAGKYIFNALTT